MRGQLSPPVHRPSTWWTKTSTVMNCPLDPLVVDLHGRPHSWLAARSRHLHLFAPICHLLILSRICCWSRLSMHRSRFSMHHFPHFRGACWPCGSDGWGQRSIHLLRVGTCACSAKGRIRFGAGERNRGFAAAGVEHRACIGAIWVKAGPICWPPRFQSLQVGDDSSRFSVRCAKTALAKCHCEQLQWVWSQHQCSQSRKLPDRSWVQLSVVLFSPNCAQIFWVLTPDQH